MNTMWYEAWLERTLLLNPIIYDVQGAGVHSRMPGQPCNCHHTRHTGHDTLVVPCLRCGSFSYHKSVGGRGRVGSARSDAFFHSSLARLVAATRRFLYWSQRFPLIWLCLVPGLQSNAIACEFFQLSGTLVVFFIPNVSRTDFFGHAVHAHRVRRWCWSAAVCSTGGGCQYRVAPCRLSARLLLPCTSCWEVFQTR